MAVIKRKLQHALGAHEARARVEAIAKKLESDLDADYRWEGSTLQFTRSGASGHIDVGDEKLEIEVKLGRLLSPLRGVIEKTLDDAIEKQLTA